MESLRIAQRQRFRQLCSELSSTSSRQQKGLSFCDLPIFRVKRVSSSLRSAHQIRDYSLHLSSRPRLQQSPALPSRFKNIPRLRSQRTVRHSSSSSASSSSSSSDAQLSLSARLKKLSREYGWSAVGVYFALSALDFPFCFLAVRLLGTERIGYLEHQVLHYAKLIIKWPMERIGWTWGEAQVDRGSREIKDGLKTVDVNLDHDGAGATQSRRVSDDKESKYGQGHGVEEATEANKGDSASMLLLLSFAVHSDDTLLTLRLRHMDTTCSGICHTQIFHLSPSTSYCGGDSKGCQDP